MIKMIRIENGDNGRIILKATHLLESGTNICYIQELLGHNSSKTTEIYTHVAICNLSRVKSPLDTILNQEVIYENE